MTQIKIFEGSGNNEADINVWLNENPQIKVMRVDMIPMYDFNYCSNDQGYHDICNQWIATIVIYQEGSGEE